MTISDYQVLQRGTDGKAHITLENGETIELTSGGPYEVGGAKNVLVGDLWVLAGQSNMEGVANLQDTEAPHPMVHSFQSREQWAVAEEPLHWLNESPRPIHHTIWGLPMPETIAPRDSSRLKGAGLGLTFAKTLAEATGVPIGLIPAAHGGTSMQQWEPSRKGMGGGSLYGATLARVQAVGGKVAGILWYQGESDANPDDAPRYQQRMTELVASFRSDLGQPDLPFFLVQLGGFVTDPDPGLVTSWNSVRESQRLWPATIPNVAVVSAIDLGLDDGIHIDTDGLKTLGRRLAATALGQQALALKSVTYNAAIHEIHIAFDHVQSALTASGRPNGFSLRDADGIETALIYKTVLNGSTAVLKLNEGPSPLGLHLWYGYGLYPYCNITDTSGASIPAFGPVPVE
ncbi:MAG: sialate O-acetylesterase [Janthinobacterium lividum]